MEKYEGPAKSLVAGFGLLQCYVLSNIFFITNLQNIPPLLKRIFVTFLLSREKQINSLLLVSVGDTDSAAKRLSRRILISRKHFLKPWK